MHTVIVLALAVVIAFVSNKSSANDIFIDVYGSGYEMELIQKNGSDNDLDINATGDDHIYSIVQDGNNNTVNLTMGGDYPTDVDINQTGDNFGFSVYYNCNNPGTSGYCNISVTQY